MELDMFDVNQPATTYCKVKSLLSEAKIADCVPSDESGHVFVELDTELEGRYGYALGDGHRPV